MYDKRFIKEVKSILYLITSYGIDRVKEDKNYSKDREIKDINHFIIQVHIGFMMAQKKILNNLKELSKDKKELRTKLKKANKDIDQRNKLKEQVKILELKENIMKKLADSIAWQLLDYDNTIIKRLYRGLSQMDVANSNVAHDI